MKKTIYALLIYHSMGAISPIYTIGAFAMYWLTSVLMHRLLVAFDLRVGIKLLRDNVFQYIDLDTQVGTKVLLSFFTSKPIIEEEV